VIRGWDEGLLNFSVGEHSKLIISPEYGYGEGDFMTIPSNSTLIFDVKLLKIVETK
jgi:FKBP-type peptidyl-prolyl cis-trans isomerase